MKKIVSIVVVALCLFLSGELLADECLEGDCDNGFGTGFTDDSKLYEGEWKHGVPHGRGKLYLSKDKIVEGVWENGELIDEKTGEKSKEKAP